MQAKNRISECVKRNQWTNSWRRRSMNSGLNRSPVIYSARNSETMHSSKAYCEPSLCLSGSAGTTHAGKSRTRFSLRKTKSWKRRRDDGLGVENIGRFVCTMVRQMPAISFSTCLRRDQIRDVGVLRLCQLLDRVSDRGDQVAFPARRMWIIVCVACALSKAWATRRQWLIDGRRWGVWRFPSYTVKYVLVVAEHTVWPCLT